MICLGSRWGRCAWRTLHWLAIFGMGVASGGVFGFEFEGSFPARDYPFVVKDSGVEVQVDAATVVEWLDNDKVIFSALKPDEPRLQDYAAVMPGESPLDYGARAKRASPGRVVVWNTRTGEIKEHSEGRLICANRGLVTTIRKAIDPKSDKLDTFPKYEVYDNKKIRPDWHKGDPLHHQDKHTCIIHDGLPKYPAPEGWMFYMSEGNGFSFIGPLNKVFSLREADGFVVIWPKNASNGRPILVGKPEAVMLIRPDGTRQPLPLHFDEVQGAWWEDWAGVYFLAQSRYDFPKKPRPSNALPLLYPDGHVEQLPIVVDNSWGRDWGSRAVLTRRGLLVTNDDMYVGTLFTNKGQSGAYLMRGDKVVRLVDWLVGNERAVHDKVHRGIAVSPDGCKVAFKHGAGERYKTQHTIKMIDVCQGDNSASVAQP